MRAAFVVLGLLALHMACLGAGFVDFDDDTIFLHNQLVQQGSLAEIFSLDRPNWRPLRDLSHRLDFAFHGQDPKLAHLHNLLLLVPLALLVGLFLRAIGRPAVWATTLLAFAHPLAVEPIAWVSGRKDLLATIFLFAALLSFQRALRGAGAWLAVVAACFALALMSKGNVIVLPALLALVWLHEHLRQGEASKRAEPGRRLRSSVALGGLALTGVMAAAFVPLVARGTVMMAGAPRGQVELLTLGDRLQLPARYAANLLYPVELNHIYLTMGLGTLHTLLAVAGALVLLAWLGLIGWWLRRRDPRAALLAAPLVLLLPHAHFITGTVYYADRYLFAALPFFMTLAVEPLARLSVGAQRMLVIGALLCAALLTQRQHLAWQDSVSLWSRMTEVYPQSAWGYDRMGRALAMRGAREQAAAAFMGAAMRAPKNPKHLNNAGVMFMQLGHREMAEKMLLQALSLDPSNHDAQLNLRLLASQPPGDRAPGSPPE